MRALVLAVIVAGACPAGADTPPPGDWLSGYWLSCENGVQTAQTWIGAGSGTMLGVNVARRANGGIGFEHLRIGPGRDGLAFFGAPSGTAAVEFPATTVEARRLVFENLAHDFPHRVMFWREGSVLHARIEGDIDGTVEGMEWTFRRARHDARCR